MWDKNREHVKLFKCPRCKVELDHDDEVCFNCEFKLRSEEDEELDD